MKIKPSKCRSLPIIKRNCREIKFSFNGNEILTICKKSIKSLGRWYSLSLTDRHHWQDLSKLLKDGLCSIDKCDLLNKNKVCCIYFGLIPKLSRPMQIYEVLIIKIEIGQLISKYTKKWLGLPNSLTNVALYSSSMMLKLLTLSLVEEFKLGKAQLFQMLRDFQDPLVKNVQPSIITGQKWKAKRAVENAESALKMKEIVGSGAYGRAGLGLSPECWWPKESTINKRKIVLEEIHHLEEVRCIDTAAAQRKQGAWTKWESVKDRSVTWGNLKHMEHKKLSFLIKAVYDILPTPVNLHARGLTTSDRCRACEKTASLKHILTGCKYDLRSYMWRHNEVLEIFAEAVKICCETANKALKNITNRAIHFIKEGNILKLLHKNKHRSSLLGGCTDWHVATNLEHYFVFPTEIALMTQRPDIVIWSVKLKKCFCYWVNGPFWRKFWPGTWV